MDITEQVEVNSASLSNIKKVFGENGFKFAEGEFRRDSWRVFGLIKGCTLELVAPTESDVVSQATIVGVLALNDTQLAFLNGRRMAALMALLTGPVGVDWVRDNMVKATTPNQISVVEDVLGEWSLRLVYNRRKSSITLKAKRVQDA